MRHFRGCELRLGRERCRCDARRYLVGIGLSAGIVLTYFCGTFFSGSLALFAEGGHALVDAVIAYGWAIFVDLRIYRRPESEQRMRRLGSFLNGSFFIVVAGSILAEVAGRGIQRIDNMAMALAAVLGVILNAIQYRVVSGGERHATNVQLNLHNLGDMIQGAALVATSIVIAATGWEAIDRLVAAAMAVWFLAQGIAMISGRHEHCHHH